MIHPNRAKEIAAKAAEFVQLFIHSGKSIQLLQPRKGGGIHPELRDFADNCVISLHGSDWGTPSYLPRGVVETLSLFQVCDIRALPDPTLRSMKGHASWLYVVFPGVYATIFDEDKIRVICTGVGSSRNLDDVLVELYLHELGHLVLHRDDLFKGLKNGLAINAQADHEEEAWLFAYCVLGHAKGGRAREAKLRTYLDDSWT